MSKTLIKKQKTKSFYCIKKTLKKKYFIFEYFKDST